MNKYLRAALVGTLVTAIVALALNSLGLLAKAIVTDGVKKEIGEDLQADMAFISGVKAKTTLGFLPEAPQGLIVAWKGSHLSIPVGWAICNGKGETPNLIGRFLRGSEEGSAGDIGGVERKKTTNAEYPGSRENTREKVNTNGDFHVTTPGHDHEVDVVPPFLNVVFIIKT